MHAATEIPLLLFTLLSQMAVGIVLAGQWALAGNKAEPVRDRLHDQSLFALIFMGVAALLSVFHLGTPLHAPFTLLHVGSSWLSREIAIVILMAAALAGLVYLRWRKRDMAMFNKLALASCLLGMLLIYAMSKVYNSPFLPGWSSNPVFFLFLASALILGALWQACALATARLRDDSKPVTTALWRSFSLACAGFIILAICLPASLPEAAPGINPNSMAASQETLATLQGWHAFLCGLGILVFLTALWRVMRKKPIAKFLIVALILAIGGEIIGRYAFYMSYAKLGM